MFRYSLCNTPFKYAREYLLKVLNAVINGDQCFKSPVHKESDYLN